MTGFINNLVARGEDQELSYTPTMVGLMIALLVLAIVAILACMTLYLLRLKRQSMQRRQQLPLYDEKRSSLSSPFAHRRIAVRPSESIIVYQEKQSLMANSEVPPNSPVPEIRITFPEEVDNTGKKHSGRVVVVRVGDHSIGLEPLAEEKLPAYQQDESDRFQSLDLDRIGGLKEKDIEARFS